MSASDHSMSKYAKAITTKVASKAIQVPFENGLKKLRNIWVHV
eukprot:CAMPEP_0185910560 /NCGR_PEP_ID=MMETSP0196C-20130402/20275_1 /TAXON_ID=2932 /ORGANISM="Alexandrium fundyense, Strain CCMP1719" /LENGTH=42 /DNA_ID= /DNA_START= /DNA_END= /DNA_ORIENTATION=